MKKTISITLNGIVFQIEEDAYVKLKEYLDSIRDYFSTYDDKGEIVNDIEARAAEQFSECLSPSKQVVTLADVEKLMEGMGSVEDIAGTETSDPEKKEPKKEMPGQKKLFRDPDTAVLFGVSSGLAAYLGVDPTIIRLLFVVSLLFGGLGVIIYAVLCLIMPEAKTTADKMEMQGQRVNLSNIKDAVEEKFSSAKKSFEESKPFRKAALGLGILMRKFAAFISIIIGVSVIIAAVAGIMGLVFAFGNLAFNANAYTDFPVQDMLPGAGFYLATVSVFFVAFIPVVFLLILGISLMRRRFSLNAPVAILLLMVWIISLTAAGIFAVRIVPEIEKRVGEFENMPKASRTFDFAGFDSISADGWYSIHVVQGDVYKIEATGYEKDMGAIDMQLEGTALRIRREYGENHMCLLCLMSNRVMDITITSPVLASYEAEGRAESDIQGFSPDTFKLKLNGSTDTVLRMDAKRISVDMDGVGELEMAGSADAMDVRMSGPVSLEAADFRAKNMTIVAEGPSEARVWATETLHVEGSGPSDISYKGDPAVTKKIERPSQLEKMDPGSEDAGLEYTDFE